MLIFKKGGVKLASLLKQLIDIASNTAMLFVCLFEPIIILS